MIVFRPISVERRLRSTGVASSGAAERYRSPGVKYCEPVEEETSRKLGTFWKGAMLCGDMRAFRLAAD